VLSCACITVLKNKSTIKVIKGSLLLHKYVAMASVLIKSLTVQFVQSCS